MIWKKVFQFKHALLSLVKVNKKDMEYFNLTQRPTNCWQPLTNVCASLWTGRECLIVSSSCECPLTSQQALLIPLFSLRFHLSTTTDLCFLSPALCIIHSHVPRLSPVLWLINKTYLHACSLTPACWDRSWSQKPGAQAELIKRLRWRAFFNREKEILILVITCQRGSCVSNLVWNPPFLSFLMYVEVFRDNPGVEIF